MQVSVYFGVFSWFQPGQGLPLCASHSPLHSAAGAVGAVGEGTWSGVFSVGTVNWGIPFLNFEGIPGMTGLFEAYFYLNFKIVSQNNKIEDCLSLLLQKSLFGAASPGQRDNGC